MAPVAITRIHTSHPGHWVETSDAAARIAARTGDERRVQAIARGSRIERRATALPSEEIAALDTIGERNAVYRRIAPQLASRAVGEVLREPPFAPVGALVASSCTGYMVPGWDVSLVQGLGLPLDCVRLPLTQAGCSGGVLAMARAAEYVEAHPGRAAIAAAVELCSLAFHADTEPGNLVSALLFGDGAGACVIEEYRGQGLQVLGSSSTLVPDTQDKIGFDLTDCGFYPRLALDLTEVLAPATRTAVVSLLTAHCLGLEDLSFALLHPGGPRILDCLQGSLRLADGAMRWSYDSLREQGNTSSAAVFDVIARYMSDGRAPGGLGLVAAFGPGVSIELMLVRSE
jgi:predicted naringenin-chalcone synthase